MSTSIYNGYRFKNVIDLKTIQKVCLRINNKIKPVAYRLFLKKYYSLLFNVIDRNTFGLHHESMVYLRDLNIGSGIHWYIQSKQALIKNTEYDFNFSFNIFPINDKILILLHTKQEKIKEIFESFPEILEYHYQDISDPPIDISSDEWDQRKIDWDLALGGDGFAISREIALSYTPYDSRNFIHNNGFFYNISNSEILTEILPTLMERSKKISRVLMENEFLKMNEYNVDSTTLYFKFLNYLESSEGEKILNESSEKIMKELTQIKSIDDLYDIINKKINFNEKININLINKMPYWLNL